MKLLFFIRLTLISSLPKFDSEKLANLFNGKRSGQSFLKTISVISEISGP